METLEEMRARHRATARYTLLLDEYRGPKTVVARNLHYDDATARMNAFNAQHQGFGRPLYVIELERAEKRPKGNGRSS